MSTSEIQYEIESLEYRLNSLIQRREEETNKQAKLRNLIDQLKLKIHNIENGLNETIACVDRKLSFISPYSKFPSKYRSEVIARLYNIKSSDAIESTKNALIQSQDSYEEICYQIKSLDSRIESVQNMINQLKQ